jgi:predicted acylesterase/phospholipase RssA/CRP-like cAMP-binding protein/DNA-binding NarL/FixJ family response regulator
MNEASPSRELNYIICVDDEQVILNQIATQLEEAVGDICTIEYAESAEEALALMNDIQKEGAYIRLVITDQVMPGMSGDRFLEQVNEHFPHTHKILLTGYAGLESAMYAINHAGLDKYIEKPWDKDEFLAIVRQLLDQSLGKTFPQGGFRIRDALQNVLIFRDLSLEEIDLIAEKLQLLEFPKDTIIFNIDDPGDCMYIIKSGEVKVIAGVGNSGEVLAYLGRGNYFGEMALLTGEPRSASVVTAMDSEIFILTKQDFEFLLKKYPSIALTLSHVLSQRLRKVSIEKAGRQNKIICVLNAIQGSPEKAIMIDIARKLITETHGKVVVIDLDSSQAQIASILNLEHEPTGSRWIIENLDNVQEDELAQILPEDPVGVKFFIPLSQDNAFLSDHIIQVLSVFKEYYHFVLVNFRADCQLDASIVKTMEQAATILYLFEQTETSAEKDCLVLQHIQQNFSHLMPKLEIVATRETQHQASVPRALYELVERHHIHYLRLDEDPVQILFSEERTPKIAQHDDVSPQINRDVSRIARRLGNVSVGLVLGGGGARAYAHLGILKILKEEHIPIDMIAGTSMGAFLGALYIQGKTIEEILEISRESWKKLKSPVSWTIPMSSFIKAKRIRNIVYDIFGDVLIEDLPIPFFCVAGDLVSGQEVIMGQGKLYEAILASGALPGFFAPVSLNNMQLVDGGVVNNVPGDVLKKQGIDIVIAVDVTPEREVHVIPASETLPASHEGNLFRRLLQYGKQIKSRYGTVLLPRIIMRVIAIEGLEITRNKSMYFDIHIKPNLEDFDLFDFGKLPHIVALGEQTGRQEITKIRETIHTLKR